MPTTIATMLGKRLAHKSHFRLAQHATKLVTPLRKEYMSLEKHEKHEKRGKAYKDLQSEDMCQRPSTVKQMHTTQANKHERCRQTRQLYETTEKSDQQSNNNQGTGDSERAVDSTARGKQSKRQRDVATRKDIKKRIS